MDCGVSLFGERKGFVYTQTFALPESDKESTMTVAVRGIDVATVGERGEVNRLFVEHVWPSAIVVSDYLCQFPELVYNKVVIELGAGAALPSLVAEKLGASLVLVTDYPEPDVLQNINEAIRINKSTKILSMGYKWGDAIQTIMSVEVLQNRNIDVILLADVLWRDTYKQHRSLLKSISLLFQDYGGIVYIGVAHRPCEGHLPENDMEFFDIATREYRYTYELVLSTTKYSDAMDSDPIEVHLFKITCPASSVG